LWNNGDTTLTTVADTSGLYQVLIADMEGCNVVYETFVEIPLDAGLQDLQGLQAGGTICGDLLLTNYDSTAIFNWSTGDSSSFIDLSQYGPGTYWVEVLEPRGCFLTDTITVGDFADFPVFSLGPDRRGCDSIILAPGTQLTSYLWSTGDTSMSLTVLSSGLYALTAGNAAGCESQDTVGIDITPSPVADFVGQVIAPLTVQFSPVQSVFASYTWHFGDGNSSTSFAPQHVYDSAGTYQVMLIATNECGNDTSLQTITLEVQAIRSTPEADALVLWPNPATQIVSVEWQGKPLTHATLSILDLQGREIHRRTLVSWDTGEDIHLDLTAWPSGLYLCRLQHAAGQALIRFRKQ
jgi:hypothetical protein